MVEVHLLSGFLGSGKTTLIANYLSQDSRQGTGVIINEAGQTTFDGLVMRSAVGVSPAIRMLPDGCLCCQATGELAYAIQALDSGHHHVYGRSIDRIIVETSGLARPGALLRQLGALRQPSIRARVLATVDATLSIRPEKFPEIGAQWAAASTLILTKTDIAEGTAREAEILAREISPMAQFVHVQDPRVRATKAFESAGELPLIGIRPRNVYGHQANVISLTQRESVSWAEGADWFDNLAALAGERLLRVKALVRTDDGLTPLLVQSVGTSFAQPTRVATDIPGHAVIIVSAMGLDELHTVQPPGIFV